MISLVNEFSALLDTCTLVPIALCDLFLRLAEDPAMYKPKWSQSILQELSSVLQSPKFHLSPEKARYRIESMQSAFPEAMVAGYEPLIDVMSNHEGDRHVLAAAVYGKVDATVTLNQRHFPDDQLSRFGIERLTPDAFLTHQGHLDEALVMSRLAAQSTACEKELRSHIVLLEKMAPGFGSLVRSTLDSF
jgi:predicted nucleic acid-binding protein